MSFCLPMNDMTMVIKKFYFIGINHCLYLPKAKLTRKILDHSPGSYLYQPLTCGDGCMNGWVNFSERISTDIRNRVEHQRRNQTATSQWPVGFGFGV